MVGKRFSLLSMGHFNSSQHFLRCLPALFCHCMGHRVLLIFDFFLLPICVCWKHCFAFFWSRKPHTWFLKPLIPCLFNGRKMSCSASFINSWRKAPRQFQQCQTQCLRSWVALCVCFEMSCVDWLLLRAVVALLSHNHGNLPQDSAKDVKSEACLQPKLVPLMCVFQ